MLEIRFDFRILSRNKLRSIPHPPFPSAILPTVIVAQLPVWRRKLEREEGKLSPSATIPRNIPIIMVVTVVIVLIITAFPSFRPSVWYTKPMLVFIILKPIPRRPKKSFRPVISPTTKPLLHIVLESEKKHPAKNPQRAAKCFGCFLLIWRTFLIPNNSKAKTEVRLKISLGMLAAWSSICILVVAIPTPAIPKKQRQTATHSPNLSLSSKKK